MFNDPITLADSSSANKVFRSNSFGQSSIGRIEVARSPDQPRTMSVSHEKTSGTNPIARRLVKFTSTDKDGAGVYHTCSVHVVITHPALFDGEAQILDLVAFVKNFLTTSNVNSLLDGEV